MLFGKQSKKGTEIPEFMVMLAIAVVLGGVAVYTIFNSASTQGSAISSWITSLSVPSSHP